MKSLFAVILNLFQNPVVQKTKPYVWTLKQRPAGFQGDDNGNIFTFFRHPELTLFPLGVTP